MATRFHPQENLTLRPGQTGFQAKVPDMPQVRMDAEVAAGAGCC